MHPIARPSRPSLRPPSLRGQLTLWFGALTLASVLGVGFYLGRIATRDLARFAGDLLHTTARSATDLLATNLRERALEIDLLRKLPLFTQGDLGGDAMRRALDQRKDAHSEYAWIGISSPEGQVLQATGGILVGEKVDQRPWFREASTHLFVGDVHDAVLLAKRLPERRLDQPLRFIDFAAPIVDANGTLRGVIGAHAHWYWVTETVEAVAVDRAAGHGIEVLIADRSGNVLYPFRLAGQTRLPDQAGPSARYERLTWADGTEYLSSTVALPPVAGADLGWRIVVRQPADEALAPARALSRQLALLGLAAALLCGLVAYRLAARFSRPLEMLAHAARAIERREGEPRYPDGTDTLEVAQLNRSFQSMTASLLEREQELSRLNTSLENQVRERTLALHQANQELENLAVRDPLTGLYNRRRFDEALQAYSARCRELGQRFALMIVDADHFKRVNDTHGHQTGDAVLRHLAGLITGCVRSTDFVARFGGEEFVVLMPEPRDREEGRLVAEKIRLAVGHAPFPGVGHLTVSIGLAFCHGGGEPLASILERADKALYQAKGEGRDRVCVAPAA
ncbi:GGDEF domain-containing protein [Paracidovorax avenae]|uniref:sensor domain-containing diguanylate cyclase n=1 Tax=Paracidovorax avenae TaxID=80867 RepID=UPI000D165E0D|nr:sensor domain-containing diguanylate cyclase [Paracidovorax avenae]AVT00140.1 GGDEF domain-containing protein [Paracidovorax avenae]AVT07093.1 GGDEF domain-containing protein [Paracidovorax avenae]AVT17681.1 GGDEF domain-containing protein [Paracidovorax avenae]